MQNLKEQIYVDSFMHEFRDFIRDEKLWHIENYLCDLREELLSAKIECYFSKKNIFISTSKGDTLIKYSKKSTFLLKDENLFFFRLISNKSKEHKKFIDMPKNDFKEMIVITNSLLKFLYKPFLLYRDNIDILTDDYTVLYTIITKYVQFVENQNIN